MLINRDDEKSKKKLKENLKINKKTNLMNKFWSLIDKNYFPKMEEMLDYKQILEKLNKIKKKAKKTNQKLHQDLTNKIKIENSLEKKKKVLKKFKSKLSLKNQKKFNSPLKPNTNYRSWNDTSKSIQSRGIFNCKILRN